MRLVLFQPPADFPETDQLQVTSFLLRTERATALITQKIEKKIEKTLKDKKHRQDRETDKIYRLYQTRSQGKIQNH